MDFEKEFDKYVEEQRAGASGPRLQRLLGDLTGTKKMFKEALLPVFRTFDGFILEYEFISSSGYRLFIDALNVPYWVGFESEGFVAHAETITRDRFDMERMRIRKMGALGILYVPFSWDELDKKPEMCRASVYELLGRFSNRKSIELNVMEKELLMSMRMMGRPFRMKDVNACLGRQAQANLMVIRKLLDKRLILPLHDGRARNHYYVVNNDALTRLMR